LLIENEVVTGKSQNIKASMPPLLAVSLFTLFFHQNLTFCLKSLK